MFDTQPARGAVRAPTAADYPPGVGLRARDVAAELRRQLPGVPVKKLHKLLYYCQGHHLAGVGAPLFDEPLSAWDMGPVVGPLWKEEHDGTTPERTRPLTDEQLNTVCYVVSRYGHLSGRDLEHLTHAELPWQRANLDRPAKGSTRIELSWVREYFTAAAAEELVEAGLRDRDVVAAWLAEAPVRARQPRSVDDAGSLRRRLADAG